MFASSLSLSNQKQEHNMHLRNNSLVVEILIFLERKITVQKLNF